MCTCIETCISQSVCDKCSNSCQYASFKTQNIIHSTYRGRMGSHYWHAGRLNFHSWNRNSCFTVVMPHQWCVYERNVFEENRTSWIFGNGGHHMSSPYEARHLICMSETLRAAFPRALAQVGALLQVFHCLYPRFVGVFYTMGCIQDFLSTNVASYYNGLTSTASGVMISNHSMVQICPATILYYNYGHILIRCFRSWKLSLWVSHLTSYQKKA